MTPHHSDRHAQAPSKTRFIFVTGGVVSSLGKGIASASIGRLLVSRGLTVGLQKFDPYINIDPGTMSPYQHGEVFVTEDGAETDLDLGHYERFTDSNTSRASNVTAGGIYDTVIRRERRGDYLGGTVQVVPHITDEIKQRISLIAQSSDVDFVITEIGGTVGDIESLPFLEAIRQFPVDVGRRRCMFIHLTLVPYIGHAGELKTKPTQHSVNELRRIGIAPDMLMCRSESSLSAEIRKKIALFASLPSEAIVSACDVDNIYKVPLTFREQGVDDFILEHFGVEAPAPDLSRWIEPIERSAKATKTVRIGLVGKYIQLEDAYLSVSESLRHAASLQDSRVEIEWIDSEQLLDPEQAAERLGSLDGILIPGGFGGRGWEGKIHAAQVAREREIPYLGICLGMHVAVSEFARNVAGLDGANSTEMDPETPHPVIDLLPEQKEVSDLGGTMRLGADPIKLHDCTRAREIYGEAVDLRAPPPPLRGQQLDPQAPGKRGPGCVRAPRPTSGWSRSSSCPITRSTWHRSSTLSSSPALSVRRRCSATSSRHRWRGPPSATRCGSRMPACPRLARVPPSPEAPATVPRERDGALAGGANRRA